MSQISKCLEYKEVQDELYEMVALMYPMLFNKFNQLLDETILVYPCLHDPDYLECENQEEVRIFRKNIILKINKKENNRKNS